MITAWTAIIYYLKGREGNRANAVLAAAGYSFSLLVRQLEELLRALFLLVVWRAQGIPRRHLTVG